MIDRRNVLKGGAAFAAASALWGCAPPAETAAPQGETPYPGPPETPRFFHERSIFGSLDTVQETSTDRLRRFATGQSDRGKGFSKPFDCVVREGRLFVSDTVNRSVMAFDFPRNRFYEVGLNGLGRVVKPLGMAIDNLGRLYICDGTTKRIQIYDLEGNYIDSLGKDGELERPSSVAVNGEGTRIYVVDTGGVRSRDHRVRVYDPSGAIVQDIGTRGSDPGQFNLPLNATVAPDGRLFVVDTGNFRIQVFGPDGQFQYAFGEAGRFPGQFSHPKGISIDNEGKLFVTDTAFGIIQLFNDKGDILMALGNRSETGGPGQFVLPAGVAADVDGRSYVVDQFFRKVEVFREAVVPKDWPVGQQKTVAMPPPAA